MPAGGWMAQCPAHDDRTPSLKIDEGHDGRALLRCFAECPTESISHALGLGLSDLFEPEEKPPPRREIARYNYTDEEGQLLYQVVRFAPKDFRQCQPDGTWGLNGTRRVLYRLPQVLDAVKRGQYVCVVEGEKDVHAIERIGKAATCNPGGAGKNKWKPEYNEPLRGAKVAVICDRDEPGREHGRMIASSLQGIAADVKVLEPKVGKDVSDHLAAGLTLRDLVCLDVPPRLRVMTARQVMALPDPEESNYLLGPLIYRGHRIVVGGHTGHGKTTFCMRMVAAAAHGTKFLDWEGKGGLKVLVIDVEQGTKTIKRVLTESGLTESDRVHYLRVPDGLSLDTDQDEIAFMEETFDQQGYDIVLADPLYKLHRGDPSDAQAATDLMRRFDGWRERFRFALVLPMHCRKPHPNSPLSAHDLFGSSAYQWGAEVLLGIERRSSGYSSLHFWKDREGELGTIGTKWDLFFYRESGFHRKKDPDPADSFSLPDFILAMVREHGGVTSTDIYKALWAQRRPYKADQIERALAQLAKTDGILHNGERLKKDRVYLPHPSMFDGDLAVADDELAAQDGLYARGA